MSSAIPGSDCVGRVIDGRFTLLRWLGGTDQSAVFFTELEGDPAHKAAIKLIPADAVDREARLVQWAAARTLSHPNVVRLFDAGRCEVDGQDLLYVVTEYAEEVLSEILRERALTPAETREMLDPVVDALSWLHGQGLVHGHLRPSNIKVVDDRLKLSADQLRAAGAPGRSIPSPGIYDAPEAATGKMSPAEDVWSLGVVLVEALTQQPPVWDGARAAGPIVPASIPQPFSGLARACLQVDPARRCTLSGVRGLLETAEPRTVEPRAVEPRVSEPPVAQPARERTAGPPSRAWMIIVASAVLVVGGLIAALVLGSHHAPHPATGPAPMAGAQPLQGAVVKGSVAYQAPPVVPQSISSKIRGHVKVRIRVQVDADGNVSDAAIDSRTLSHYFANHALQAARAWKFKPAQVGGRAVSSTWLLRFQFARTGTEVAPDEVSP